MTDNQLSLKFHIKMNDEILSNPMLNGCFELHAGTSGFLILQNIVDGSQPIAIFNSLAKPVELFGDLDIPDFYNKNQIHAIGGELSSLFFKTHILKQK